jgi:hypothetical protein
MGAAVDIRASAQFPAVSYKSAAQRRWAHTQAGLKALGGKSAVHEWDEASKGKKLPEHAKKRARKHRLM